MSNSRLPSPAQPRIVILSATPAWNSVIRRALTARGHSPKTALIQALDWSDSWQEIQSRPFSLGVIGWTRKNLSATCRQVHAVANNPYSAKFVSVAEAEFRDNETLLRQFGFADCFWSVIQAERLVKIAERLAGQMPANAQTIEQSVRNQLPWKTAQN